MNNQPEGQDAEGAAASERRKAHSSPSRPPANFAIAGLRLTFLARQDLALLPASATPFWIAVALSSAWGVLLGYVTASPPIKFSTDGLENDGFFCLLNLLICYLLAKASKNAALLWPLAALVTYASIIPDTLYTLIYVHMPASMHDWLWYQVLYIAVMIWTAALFASALANLNAGGSTLKRLVLSVLSAAFLGVCGYLLPTSGFWEIDYARLYERQVHEKPLIAEDVLSRQDDLLGKSLAAIAPGQAGHPHLYFVAFAPYARQDVFSKEALYTTHLFETDFAAQGRTLALINNRAHVTTIPLASVTNLRAALAQIGKKMIPDQDILFLFLTSHGSPDAELSVSLPGVSLNPLNADELSRMLDAARIRWRVIVVSSCYSGSFVKPLQNDTTLVMTAARADRTSFGCSDTADFTYFGRAYFKEALSQTDSFIDAFGIARNLINEWETKDDIQHAEPQISIGRLIPAKLAEWQGTLPARAHAPMSAGASTIAQNAASGAAGGKLESQTRKYVAAMQTYKRWTEAQLIFSFAVVSGLLVILWQAYRRHGHRSFLLLAIGSVGALVAGVIEFLLLFQTDPLRVLLFYYIASGIMVAQMLVAAWGTVALIRSYRQLAENHRPPA